MDVDSTVSAMTAAGASKTAHEVATNALDDTRDPAVDSEAITLTARDSNSPMGIADTEAIRDGDGNGGGGGSSGRAWDVYCDGPLLTAVQNARLFADSKTFVDMPMKKDPADVLAAFAALSDANKEDPTKLKRFVEEYFEEAGSDIVSQVPADFVPEPPFLELIKDTERRQWAKSIHSLWPSLVRKGVEDVALHPERHSLLPRRYPVVVPGGRFRESYYWDTFWTVRGLLVSGMVDTAMGAVLNLLDDTDRFGFVPNGGRIYYTERSQPPLLSDMVCEVYAAHPDTGFLARALPALELEHAFWMDFERGRAVCAPAPPPPSSPSTPPSQAYSDGGVVLLNRYWGCLESPMGPTEDTTGGRGVGRPLRSRQPRPESYREDMDAACGVCTCGGAAARASAAAAGVDEHASVGIAANGACHELAAGAESGWDFSSRWGSATTASRVRAAENRRRRRRAYKALGLKVPPEEAGGESEMAAAASVVSSGRGNGTAEGGVGGEGEKNSFCLCEISTTAVVPADLNAFMHRAELNIARLHHAHHVATVCCRTSARSWSEDAIDTFASYDHAWSSSPNPTGTVTSVFAPEMRPESTAAASAATRGSRASSTGTVATPPPTLLSLDQIQRRYLSRDRRTYGSSSGSVGLDCLSPDFTRGGGAEAGGEGFGGEASSHDPNHDADEGGHELGFDVRVVEEGGAMCQKAMLLLAAASARAKAMEETMWDNRRGLWRDLLLPTGQQSPSITPACYVPLWAGLPWPRLESDGESAGARLGRCVTSIRNSGLIQPGGVCTSTEDSGQQWDGRNAWPPLQWLLIQGLRRSADAAAIAEFYSSGRGGAARNEPEARAPVEDGDTSRAIADLSIESSGGADVADGGGCCDGADEANCGHAPQAPVVSFGPEATGSRSFSGASTADMGTAEEIDGIIAARELAAEIEESFLKAAMAGWERTGAMMEKYNAKETGKGGGGGEYDLQIGFGWTNGVALDLMAGRSKQ